MSERLIEKLDRLGLEAGIENMTPEIRRFALLVRNDVVSGWPAKPWVPLTEFDIDQIPYSCTHADSRLIAFAIEAKLKERNA